MSKIHRSNFFVSQQLRGRVEKRRGVASEIPSKVPYRRCYVTSLASVKLSFLEKNIIGDWIFGFSPRYQVQAKSTAAHGNTVPLENDKWKTFADLK
jgi:hypothetical protein